MHCREYPLLNTPHLVIVLLKEAASGAASVEDCATRLGAILEAADEHPPVGADEVLRRLDVLRRNLTEAQLVAPADGERFAIAPRGRDALKQHPAGFDTADLMVYPEFERFIRGLARPRRRMDPGWIHVPRDTMRASPPTGRASRRPTIPTRPTPPTTSHGRTAGSRRSTRM